MYDRYQHLLESLDLVWLDLEIFSQAIHAKGAPLTQCWGFIEGTVRPICRPIHLIVVPELQEPTGTRGDSAIHLQHASYIQKE